MIIAYLRVTTIKQHLEIQKDEINRFASDKGMQIDKWVIEAAGEKVRENERNLDVLLKRMQKGDTLIVSDISRLSRTLADVMATLGCCMEKGVHLYCINNRYIFDDKLNTSAMARAFGLVADIEHSLMSTRTKEALNDKKPVGRPLGRPKGSDAKQSFLEANKEEVISMLEQGETVISICKHFNVSRNTYYQFKRNYGL